MTSAPLASVPAVLVPLLGELCEALRQVLADARTALARSNAQTLRDASHSLKGAAMRFGLDSLANAAARAEDAAAAGDLDDAAASLAEFEKILDEVAALI